jgi:hypothetical protein
MGFKEARALLGWSPKQLADEAALSVIVLEAFEDGRERLAACWAAQLPPWVFELAFDC